MESLGPRLPARERICCPPRCTQRRPRHSGGLFASWHSTARCAVLLKKRVPLLFPSPLRGGRGSRGVVARFIALEPEGGVRAAEKEQGARRRCCDGGKRLSEREASAEGTSKQRRKGREKRTKRPRCPINLCHVAPS
ncbi:hypothetical protein MRX96_054521 [Rhipicephalus microplus]